MVSKSQVFRLIRGAWRPERDADAAVVTPLVVDLEDADGRRIARRGEMGAAAGLSIEANDLDDADPAVGRGRRRHRAAADQPAFRLSLGHREGGEGHWGGLGDNGRVWSF